MAFDLGDLVPLSFQVKDTAGNLANGTTVTLTITQPDGTAAGPFTLTPTTTGVYDYDFLPTQVGRHVARCVSTGSNASSFSDAFDVDPADMGGIVSLADAKKHLNMSARTDDDEELRFWIAVTTALVEHEVGPVTQTSHTEIVDAAETIVLAKAPVLAVSSVVQTFPYFGAFPFTTPQYALDGPSGILRMQPWLIDGGFAIEPFYGLGGMRLTITYTTGRPTIPANVRAGALVGLKHLWQEQRLAGPLQGNQSDDPEQLADRVEMPPKFYALLRPNQRSGRFA